MQYSTRTRLLITVFLLLTVAILFEVHRLIFHDVRTFAFYFLLDLTLIPVQVLVVTLLFDQLLKQHEKKAMLGKLNMVIGVYFSETGTRMLQQLMTFKAGGSDCQAMAVTTTWTDRDYAAAAARMSDMAVDLVGREADLEQLRDFLIGRRQFLLGLLENPNLLEHESFTQLLWAVFHLTEELAARPSLRDLPSTDLHHLAGDMKRAANLNVTAWLAYMQHLQRAYPYLFSLAVRINPFVIGASPIVRS